MNSSGSLKARLRTFASAVVAARTEIGFAVSVFVIGFVAGFVFTQKQWFPYSALQNAHKTIASLRSQLAPPFSPYEFLGFSGGPIAAIKAERMITISSDPGASEHLLLEGGFDQYLDYCPKSGCLAVEFARNGSLVHAWPYFPEEFARHEIASLPYEQLMFSPTVNRYPIGLLKLPNGDLIVSFQQWNMFPFAGGIARVRPDGHVVWFRHEYDHHWPTLLPDGEIATPAMRIAGSKITARLGGATDVELKCDGKIEDDIVRILDTDGRVKQEISVLDAVLRSPFRGMLFEAPVPCAPVHLNYIAQVTIGMVSLFRDVSPDDLLVSMRDLNAFGILGRHDQRLKHVFTGTFLRQHAVVPFGQSSTVLMFDDHGADWNAGPSRLLAYDMATHSERTIFPNSATSPFRMFSDVAGTVSISPDLSRAIVSSNWEGRAFEVRISDGKVLTVFNNVHDLRNVEAAGDGRSRAAGRFVLGGAWYVH